MSELLTGVSVWLHDFNAIYVACVFFDIDYQVEASNIYNIFKNSFVFYTFVCAFGSQNAVMIKAQITLYTSEYGSLPNFDYTQNFIRYTIS